MSPTQRPTESLNIYSSLKSSALYGPPREALATLALCAHSCCSAALGSLGLTLFAHRTPPLRQPSLAVCHEPWSWWSDWGLFVLRGEAECLWHGGVASGNNLSHKHRVFNVFSDITAQLAKSLLGHRGRSRISASTPAYKRALPLPFVWAGSELHATRAQRYRRTPEPLPLVRVKHFFAVTNNLSCMAPSGSLNGNRFFNKLTFFSRPWSGIELSLEIKISKIIAA